MRDSANRTQARAVKTRIAPSPTGRMHAGNIFAALCSWLVARRGLGEVVLRIEDIDRERSRLQHADQIIRDLEWLGLECDGEVLYQSDRSTAYEQAISMLEDKGLVYPCFCSRHDLSLAAAPQQGDMRKIYPGTCRDLSERERMERAARSRHSLRVRVPAEDDPSGDVEFIDRIQGRVSAKLGVCCGDFLVRRSDSLFAYQLAVVVDDAEQGINCIVRGCDLLDSVPQQLYLRSVLTGHEIGELVAGMSFYHVPLLVDKTGRRLAKRNRDASLDELKTRFRTPEALLGHIAFVCGLVPGRPDEPITLDELLREFTFEGLRLRWAIEYR